jgi:hypothetical protein
MTFWAALLKALPQATVIWAAILLLSLPTIDWRALWRRKP